MQHLAKRKAEKKNQDDPSWQNFKLILGNEIYLVRNGLNKDNFIAGEDRYYHFILLAKDDIGHKQIRELSSRAWKRSFFRFLERVPTYYSDIEEVIGANPGHVIASTACLGGFVGSSILKINENQKHPEIVKVIEDRLDVWLEWMVDTFGRDNFFLEKQPSHNKEQWIVNRDIEKLAGKFNIKCIITTDAHYARKEDRHIHKAYLNAKQGDREVDEFYASTYIMSSKEVLEYFQLADQKYGSSVGAQSLTDVVERDLFHTIEIASRIENYSLEHSPIIPFTKIDWAKIQPASLFTINGKNYPFIDKFITSPYEQDRYFISRVIHKLNTGYDPKYLENRLEEYYDRIETECRELWNISDKLGQRLSSYQLLISEIIRIVWDEGGSLVGVGRGSSSGFLTNYLLDIVQIDPLQADIELPHWRFISEYRVSLPDIDIDTESNKREQILQALRKHFGQDKVVNVATFTTEKSKSAIQTAARGLGISDDVSMYLSSMVPSERGFLWSLEECFYGNVEEGRAPVSAFVREMTENYPDLWAVAQRIEGLVSRRGIHAAGVLISNEDFAEHNAIMKAPNGAWTSQYELKDTEFLGGVKLDLLSIEALDKIRVAIDLLIGYDYVEPKGSLRETYMSILNPADRNILLYDNEEIWDLVANNSVLSLFQLDTPVGATAARQVKPRNIAELSAINSLMRLMGNGGEMPLDTFMRYRADTSLWYKEMTEFGLTKDEQDIMTKHLGSRYGVAESQESMMLMAIDPQIAGFTIGEADKLRKAVAKKSFTDFEKMEQLFYEKGKELGTSEALLRYVWEVQIKRQKGYSFSQNHTYVYSIIALQELNLVYRYPDLFWNCANLIVDSGGIEVQEENMFGDDDESSTLDEIEAIYAKLDGDVDDDDDDVEEGEVVEDVKKKEKNKNVNYGKVGAALGKMKSAGVNIALPDINRSSYTFAPDVENNAILFGIKGITGINDTIVKTIMQNRPYTSLNDLLKKVKLTKPQVVNLIKSGSLDRIEKCERVDIMRKYINSIADAKTTLNLRNMQMLVQMDLIPIEMDFYRRLFNFNRYLKKFKQDIYYVLDTEAMRFFEQNYDNGVLVQLEDGSFAIEQKRWDKTYTKGMDAMRDYIKEHLEELLFKVNDNLTREVWQKYGKGNISRWEMDSLTYYYHEHELAKVNYADYGVENFFDHGEEPEVATIKMIKGRPVPIFRLWRIVGTVLSRDKTKHIVTLLTPDGVVDVRVWQSQFVKYDKQISEKQPDGKKKIIEKSWFTRGNMLIITGIRRGANFIPKVYKNSVYENPIELIVNVDDNGKLLLREERAGE